ncbi:MAG: hypothetical protein NTY38_13655 [Acidobacteria bacterium]|nr:hypothetical protein [Acidobacteriota bacterium]
MISRQLDIAAANRHRQRLYFYYWNSIGAWVQGSPFSLWPFGGTYGYPGPGAAAPSPPGEIPTAATAGALRLTVVPRAGNNLYLGRSKFVYLHGTSSVMGGAPTLRAPLRLYDRLYHCQFACVSTGTITINGATVTRGEANGVGNSIAIEVVNTPSGGTIGVTYINQDGAQKQTSTTAPMGLSDGSTGRWLQCLLAAGDTGVQSIVSVQCNNLTFPTNKVEMVVIVREIAHLFSSWPPQSNLSDAQDALDHGLAQIDQGSCLFLVGEAQTTSPDAPAVIGGWLDVLEA